MSYPTPEDIKSFEDQLNKKDGKEDGKEDSNTIINLNSQKIISDKPILIEMSKSDSINIDTVEDFNILEERLCK